MHWWTPRLLHDIWCPHSTRAKWEHCLQAAIEAGKRDVASDALSKWLDSQRGAAGAAAAIGTGGSVSSRELEAMLKVGAALHTAPIRITCQALYLCNPEYGQTGSWLCAESQQKLWVQERAAQSAADVCTWEMLGFARTLRGEHAAAAEAFGSAAKAGGGRDTTTLCLLGSALAQQRMHGEAERVFKAAAGAARPGQPEAARAWTGLGRSQAAQGAARYIQPHHVQGPPWWCFACMADGMLIDVW
jgi:hypothetical protein